jgi:hypothetical protein
VISSTAFVPRSVQPALPLASPADGDQDRTACEALSWLTLSKVPSASQPAEVRAQTWPTRRRTRSTERALITTQLSASCWSCRIPRARTCQWQRALWLWRCVAKLLWGACLTLAARASRFDKVVASLQHTSNNVPDISRAVQKAHIAKLTAEELANAHLCAPPVPSLPTNLAVMHPQERLEALQTYVSAFQYNFISGRAAHLPFLANLL